MPFQPKAWAVATLAFAVVAVIAGTEAGATREARATAGGRPPDSGLISASAHRKARMSSRRFVST